MTILVRIQQVEPFVETIELKTFDMTYNPKRMEHYDTPVNRYMNQLRKDNPTKTFNYQVIQ